MPDHISRYFCNRSNIFKPYEISCLPDITKALEMTKAYEQIWTSLQSDQWYLNNMEECLKSFFTVMQFDDSHLININDQKRLFQLDHLGENCFIEFGPNKLLLMSDGATLFDYDGSISKDIMLRFFENIYELGANHGEFLPRQKTMFFEGMDRLLTKPLDEMTSHYIPAYAGADHLNAKTFALYVSRLQLAARQEATSAFPFHDDVYTGYDS